MRAIACTIAVLAALAIPVAAQTRIDSINTNFRWLGPDDKIIVERYDDPKIANVSCYMSRADTGGIKGGLGLAEDPSRFSIACRAVGPIVVPPGLPKSEVIAFASASLFLQDVPNPPRYRCREERAGLHRRKHKVDQWLAIQQHQRRAGRDSIDK
jgi:catabolite regulation protein CreA